LPQALQYFLAIVPRVEAAAWLDVHNCKLDQGLKINVGPPGIHAVEEFAPVPLAGAIETSEEVLSELLA
jgi:hypothetical protein